MASTGIGGAFGCLLSALLNDAGTADIVAVMTRGRRSTGTPAAGFGAADLWTQSSTTNDQNAAIEEVYWDVATHATRAAAKLASVFLQATKQAYHQVIAASGGVKQAWFGATPVARPALGSWASLTTDQKLNALRDALSNLGLASYT